jgi:heme iron utilization protein
MLPIVLITIVLSASIRIWEDKKIAAKIARMLLHRSNVYGELGTIEHSSNNQIEGFPYVSVQAISDHCPSDGKPFLMLVSWGSHATNLAHNSNASIFIRDSSWYKTDRGKLDLPRFTIFGQMKKVDYRPELKECFEHHHRDSGWKDGHDFQFYEMDPVQVNFIGGFGDEHYVGWLDMNEYLL